jgi:hypothetical protein
MFRNRMDASAPGIRVGSVYERALGSGFAALDPQLQSYFGRIAEGCVGVANGVFDEAGLRVGWLRPVFVLLGRWHIAFAEHGRDVPFTVRNVPTADGALTARRTFHFATGTREMRDAMRVVGDRIVDRVGPGGRFEVEFELAVVGGGLTMESRRIALRIGRLRVPVPPIVRIRLRERAWSEGVGRFVSSLRSSLNDREVGRGHAQHVDVRMVVWGLGEVYGYRGTFRYAVLPA